MTPLRYGFLSEEDLDLRNMSQEALFAYWDLWLEQAQAANDADDNTYSHGIFFQFALEAGSAEGSGAWQIPAQTQPRSDGALDRYKRHLHRSIRVMQARLGL